MADESTSSGDAFRVEVSSADSLYDVRARDMAPLTVTFTITNVSATAKRLLMRRTPLEGLLCECFEIKDPHGYRAGYVGLSLKRSEPAPTEFITFQPGEISQKEVDLSTAWRFTIDGEYEIRFKNKLHWHDAEVEIPSAEVLAQKDSYTVLTSNSITVEVIGAIESEKERVREQTRVAEQSAWSSPWSTVSWLASSAASAAKSAAESAKTAANNVSSEQISKTMWDSAQKATKLVGDAATAASTFSPQEAASKARKELLFEAARFDDERAEVEAKLEKRLGLPWELDSDDSDLAPVADEFRESVMELSTKESSFLSAPSSGSNFEFDVSDIWGIAPTLLEEDAVLASMRMALVPRKVSEEEFWRNYFYRVHCVKEALHMKVNAIKSREEAVDDAQFGQVGLDKGVNANTSILDNAASGMSMNEDIAALTAGLKNLNDQETNNGGSLDNNDLKDLEDEDGVFADFGDDEDLLNSLAGITDDLNLDDDEDDFSPSQANGDALDKENDNKVDEEEDWEAALRADLDLDLDDFGIDVSE